MTTKREYEDRARYYAALQSLGFTHDECEQLRRISRTLHRWHELECGDGNGHIERCERTGTPRYFNSNARYASANDPRAWHVIPDREKEAQKRLLGIINALAARKGVCDVNAFIQSDPRGAALYILRPGDVPKGGSADAYYMRGICVY